MEDLEKYRKLGQELFDKLRLFTFPIAIKILKKGEEIPSNGKFFRPHDFLEIGFLHVQLILRQDIQGLHFILKVKI